MTETGFNEAWLDGRDLDDDTEPDLPSGDEL